ncbi:MAG: MFS transporter [Halioglobus sp.]|nr:MFS transporter [Halioglobus sp.]
MADVQSARHRYVTLLALILAGEVIFSLPFHIPRFFRPTLLDALHLSNTQLGDIFALYGIVALLSYFPGGMIADHFSARNLMVISLLATALGGMYLYTLPGHLGLYLVFAYWGVTTILLFWAALIKAARYWGGREAQGLAFGVLDGGRGLIASVLATAALFLLSDRVSRAGADSATALQAVILFYTATVVLGALVIWRVLPSDGPKAPAGSGAALPVIREPSVWLQAGIVVCAYCGFKSLDNYGVYAVEVLGMTQVEAAALSTYASYSRPVAAILAGLCADRWRSSGLVLVLFLVATTAFYVLSRDVLTVLSIGAIFANLMVTFVAVYALRGIYFSLIEESRIDRRVTGSAVGLISVLGFTPDIFFAAVTGRILDANPGGVGFQYYFLLMAFISVAGMVCTWVLARRLALHRQGG